MPPPSHFNVIIVPDGSSDASRTLRVSRRRLQILATAAGLGAVVVIMMIASWSFLARTSLRALGQEREIEQLREQASVADALVAQLEELEARYEQIRLLFGVTEGSSLSGLWLPPPAGRTSGNPPRADEMSLPTEWPVAAQGFVTQALLEPGSGDHPGLDIAVGMDTYIRAAGSGTIVDLGEDDVYGRYVVVDHGNGYETRYAHASRLLTELGRQVRQGEVIALSGSSGRSTAPHLHFEIRVDGETVDPMTMLRRP